MKKKMLSRAVSLVLALAMLVSILPAVSLAAGETVSFDLAKVAAFTQKLVSEIPEITGIDYLPDESTAGGGQTRRLIAWDGLIQVQAEAEWTGTTGSQSQLVFTADLGDSPSAGWYQIKFTGGDWYPASDLYIYANDTYVGSYIPKKNVGSVAVGSEVTYGAVYLEPDADGKVKFKFAIAKRGASSAGGTGTYGEGRILLHNLSLTYLGAESEYGYKISHTMPAELSMGDVIGVDYSAYLDAGDGIARTMNGIDSTRAANGDFFKVEVAQGESLELTSTVTDGAAAGKLIPKSLGETTLKITASLGGETYETTHTVNVVEPAAPPEPVEVTVDFTQSEITDGVTAQTIKADGQYTAVAEETGSYGGSYTKLVTVESDKVLQLTHKRYDNAKWLWLTAPSEARRKDAQFTIKVPIAAPGYYKLNLSGYKFAAEGSEYYVYADDKYAGFVSFYGGENKEAFTKQLNTLYLEPDSDNTVKIKFATAANPAEKWINILYLKTLTLTPVEAPETVAFEEFSENLPENIYISASRLTSPFRQ